METKEMTIKERIGNLPEVYRNFAKVFPSEEMLKTLEMAARLDALHQEGKAISDDDDFIRFDVGNLTLDEAFYFAMEYSTNEEFRKFGVFAMKDLILKKVKLVERYFE